jgi:hypothetical protein
MNVSNRALSLINNYRNGNATEKTQTLKQLKLLMLSLQTLPPSNEKMDIEEFYLARDILELEMEHHINNKDGKNFELSYLKIKQFYFDFK